MNLRVYLATQNMTVKAFADQLDIVPNYISAIKNGTKLPGRKLARKIKQATNGEVDLTKNEVAA